MQDYMIRRLSTKRAIDEVAAQAHQVKTDTRLTGEGKTEKLAPLNQKAVELLEKAVAEFAQSAQVKQQNVETLTAEVGTVDPAEVASKAAVLTPALASMDYESILRLYEARANDHAERALIEQYINIKIDSDGHSAEKQMFVERFGQVSQRIYKTLPGAEKLGKVQAEADYLQSVHDVFAHQLKEWQGVKIEGHSKIGRRFDIGTLERYEQTLA